MKDPLRTVSSDKLEVEHMPLTSFRESNYDKPLKADNPVPTIAGHRSTRSTWADG
jgi:hypothetical protein